MLIRSIVLVLCLLCNLLGSCKQTEPKPPNSGIDVVYTWVNGQDVNWRELKVETLEKWKQEIPNPDSYTNNRFRDREELKYSLRSIHKNLPFVNHIYIVTCGQKPSWLKKHPMVTIVEHKEIFKNPAHLPTFNSQAIEANLHRIPGLSDKYLYMNDDFVVTAPLKEEHFFSKDGKIKVFAGRVKISKDASKEGLTAFVCSVKNMDAWLDANYKQESRVIIAHAPYVMKKSLIEEFESKHGDVLDITSSHPFRLSNEYAITNGVIPYYALYTGQAELGELKTCFIRVGPDKRKNRRDFKKIEETGAEVACFEDKLVIDSSAIDEQLVSFLQDSFPEKAPWER